MPDFLGPDFLGIGAQKAGTTWLYAMLAHHPGIVMPECKEVHFWDKHYEKGYAWYEALFHAHEQARESAGELASVPRSGSGSSSWLASQEGSALKKRGEITPAYAILPQDTIAEIHGRYPHLRLIYLVRDPVARAWSAALMEMKKAGLDFSATPDSWFLEQFRSEGSLARGDYATCIRNWLAVFPKEQLLVLDYEDITRDPRALLVRVAEHLGVDGGFFSTLDEKHFAARRNEGSGEPLRPSLHAALEELYAGK